MNRAQQIVDALTGAEDFDAREYLAAGAPNLEAAGFWMTHKGDEYDLFQFRYPAKTTPYYYCIVQDVSTSYRLALNYSSPTYVNVMSADYLDRDDFSNKAKDFVAFLKSTIDEHGDNTPTVGALVFDWLKQVKTVSSVSEDFNAREYLLTTGTFADWLEDNGFSKSWTGSIPHDNTDVPVYIKGGLHVISPWPSQNRLYWVAIAARLTRNERQWNAHIEGDEKKVWDWVKTQPEITGNWEGIQEAENFDPRDYLLSGERLEQTLEASGFHVKPNPPGQTEHPMYQRIDSANGEEGPFEQGDTMWQVTIWDNDLAILYRLDYELPDAQGYGHSWKFPAQGGEQRMTHAELQDMLSTLGESIQEAEDFDAAAYWKEPQWPPTGFVQNGPNAIYGHESKEPFTDAQGRKYHFNIHIYPEDRQYILTVYGRYFDSWHDFHQETVKFDDDLEGYMEAIKKAIAKQKPGNRSYPRLPDFEPFEYGQGIREAEDFDAREYLLSTPQVKTLADNLKLWGFEPMGNFTSDKHPSYVRIDQQGDAPAPGDIKWLVTVWDTESAILYSYVYDAEDNAFYSDHGQWRMPHQSLIDRLPNLKALKESEDFNAREYLTRRVADEDELKMAGAVQKDGVWELTDKRGNKWAFFATPSGSMWNLVHYIGGQRVGRWSQYLTDLLDIVHTVELQEGEEPFDARDYLLHGGEATKAVEGLFREGWMKGSSTKRLAAYTMLTSSFGRQLNLYAYVYAYDENQELYLHVSSGLSGMRAAWGVMRPEQIGPVMNGLRQMMGTAADWNSQVAAAKQVLKANGVRDETRVVESADFDAREYMLADQGLADLRHWLETNGFKQSATASNESWKRSFWYHNSNARAGRHDRSDYNIWEAPDKPGEWYFQRKDTTQSRRSGVREDIIQQFHGTPAEILVICKKWVPNDRHAELRDPMQEAVSTMPLADILAKVEPQDYTGYTWEQAFKSIESNHVAGDPAHWGKFLESVKANGIRRPVEIERRGDRLLLWRGHHRVWAAHKLGIKDVPVKLTVREAEELPAPTDDFDAREYMIGADEMALEQALVAQGFRRTDENYWLKVEAADGPKVGDRRGPWKTRRYDHTVSREHDGRWLYRRYYMPHMTGPGGTLDSRVLGTANQVVDALETWNKQKSLRQYIHQESEDFDARAYLDSMKAYEGPPPGKEYWVLFKEGTYQRAVKLYNFKAVQRFVHDKNLEKDDSLILRVRDNDDSARDYMREPDGTYIDVGSHEYVERFTHPGEVEEAEDENILQYALTTPVKPIGWIGVSHSQYRDSYLNTRRPFMVDVIGDAQVFKRRSSLNGWPHLEAVPVYSDPRKTGMGALDPYYKPRVYTRRAIAVPESMQPPDDFDAKEYLLSAPRGRFGYRVKRDTTGYGPWTCHILLGDEELDWHTCCETKQEADDLGVYWVTWLDKLDTLLPFDPIESPNWLDWYSKAYGLATGKRPMESQDFNAQDYLMSLPATEEKEMAEYLISRGFRRVGDSFVNKDFGLQVHRVGAQPEEVDDKIAEPGSWVFYDRELQDYTIGTAADIQAAVYKITESMADDIAKEAAKAEQPKSEEQAEAGNQKKGHVSLQGFEIAIENAKDSIRKSKDPENPWQVTMPAHYGYIKGTQGKDKDHLDVYIGEHPSALLAFVVNQKKKEGGFDEHKIMLGFESKDEAIATYDKAFTGDLGPKLRDEVFSVTIDSLKAWIENGDTKKPFKPIEESRAAMIARVLLEAEDFNAREYLLTSEQYVITFVNGHTGQKNYYGRPTEHQCWVEAPIAAERFNTKEDAMAVIAKFENPFVQMRIEPVTESEDFDARAYFQADEAWPAVLGRLGYKHVEYETGPYQRWVREYPNTSSITCEPVVGELAVTVHWGAYLEDIAHIHTEGDTRYLDAAHHICSRATNSQQFHEQFSILPDDIKESDDFSARDYLMSEPVPDDMLRQDLKRLGFTLFKPRTAEDSEEVWIADRGSVVHTVSQREDGGGWSYHRNTIPDYNFSTGPENMMRSLPRYVRESEDFNAREFFQRAQKFTPRPIPPDAEAQHALFARKETTTDSATKDMLRAGGDKDLKGLSQYKDVVLYSDREGTRFVAKIPWHHSGKPVSRSREVVLGGNRRQLYWIGEAEESFNARDYFMSIDKLPLGRAVDISDDIWKDDNKLRKAFSWMTRIGAAPKFGTTSIHNYQTEQCEKLDAIKVYARQKGVTDVKWVRYRNGRIYVYDTTKWKPVCSLIYGNLVPNVR